MSRKKPSTANRLDAPFAPIFVEAGAEAHQRRALEAAAQRDITATRLDFAALGLIPLALHEQGEWNPDEEYWGKTVYAREGWNPYCRK